MSLLPNVYWLLTQDPAVNAIVGSNVFRERAHAVPDGAYIVWAPLAITPENNLSDRPPIDVASIRLDLFAHGEDEVDTLAAAVRNSVEGVGAVESAQSLGQEEETGLWHFVIDFDWHHHRA